MEHLSKDLDPTTMKAMIENLQLFNPTAFATHKQLMEEIHGLNSNNEPLGLVLVSSNEVCSHITVYTKLFGTLLSTHYHKYFQNQQKGCSFRQYYRYHSHGDKSVAFYDTDWDQLDYFISSSETAIEMKMLSKFDVELLFGHISYKQKADIYNYSNSFEVEPKKCSSLEIQKHQQSDEMYIKGRNASL